MKTLITILSLSLLIAVNPVNATRKGTAQRQADSLSIKCLLSSADLFYGIELGEKPLRDMVDTLVNDIQYYDTASQLNLVIVSAKQLGFTYQTDILWEEILDSAESKGYGICPPQIGAELYVQSQNMPKNKALLMQKVSGGKPVFIGMNRMRHEQVAAKNSFLQSVFGHKAYFDYVFCIKRDLRNGDYELGYAATNTANDTKNYTWNSNDVFIFINKGNKNRPTPQYCNN